MADSTNKQLRGNQLSSDVGIRNFKVDGSDIVIILAAGFREMNLNILDGAVQNKLTVDFTSVQIELLSRKIEEK